MAVQARVSFIKGSRERTIDHENIAVDSLRCEYNLRKTELRRKNDIKRLICMELTY